jgi:hypothetical protein
VAVGLEHLEKKRTGRPKGSKTSPAWVRALRWAERNLGKPDAEAQAPSELARYLLALGREHPDRFLACLALLEPLRCVGPGSRLPFRLTLSAAPHNDFVRLLERYRASLPWVCKVSCYKLVQRCEYDRPGTPVVSELVFEIVPLDDKG